MMKRQIFYLIIIAILLEGCNSGNTNSNAVNVNSNSNSEQSIKHFMKGVWVLSDYIKDIEITKSPYKSKDKLLDVVSMMFNENIQGDSVLVSINLSNHMGGAFTAYIEKWGIPNRIKTNFKDYNEKTNTYELGFEIKGVDTLLFLNHYDKTNTLLDKRQFEKVLDKQTDDDCGGGIQFIVNEKLFKGNYLLIDSTNTEYKVRLENDGTLKGFPGFKKYYIITDFVIGVENDRDQIIFDLYTENQKSYAYTTNQDTINIYKYVLSQDYVHLLLDKLKYRLIRQK